MAPKHVFFILALTCLIMANIANATSRNDCLNNNMKPGYDLVTRLEASGGLTEYWNVLMELKSCSNEIVIFFLSLIARLILALTVAALLISSSVIVALQCSPLSDSLPNKGTY
ncbi:hypothetical protein CUMW_270540 [Citrus unshiu]|uniref:Uncharacterized protein n=1 Tax=Citrus unshiu TaxID=55188 RepID=A0A2H5QXB2_CITUN|nr:hypothetical protein CUMW_270540 [Citrus unshiu]